VTLTVIVPATDAPSTLDTCLAAIRGATDPPEELLVIDEAAGGPSAARNAGAERAVSDVLVFVDSDVQVHPDAFTRIRQAFEGDDRLAAVIGSYDAAQTANGVVTAFRNLLHHHVHQSAAGSATTFWTGLGAIRREAFLAVGGFDARRFPRPSVEDIELGMRLAQRGARIRLDPGLQGTHLKRWTVAGMVRTDLLQRGVPWLLLLMRAGRGSATLNLGWRHRLSAVAAVGGAGAVAARRPAALAACLSALVALNWSFYALLWRVRGPADAGVGVALHVVHHLTSTAAVPVAAAAYARERWARGHAPGA
jgi:cellulose synthase/poly-beta-1,6-N-acetylglucosamine synthase-like glycosyltransferase